MIESSDKNTTYEDIFNSYMSTLCAYSRKHISTLESNKTESDYDTSDKSIDKDSVEKIRRERKKTKKKTIKINNLLINRCK